MRRFSSEFKRFFGFDDRLEEMKHKNDSDLNFEVEKMNKFSVLLSASCKSFAPLRVNLELFVLA